MKLTDDSVMPWGKHKGQRLQDVPPDYLLWLGDEIVMGKSEFRDALMVYIADNRECLEKEKAGEL